MTKKECEMLIEISVLLHIFFDSDHKKAATWLYVKNLNLGNVRPTDMILTGRIKRLYQFVKAARFGDL